MQRDHPATVTAYAPGRVNVIGDHTDYTGGLVLPMAIQMGTTVSIRREGDVVELASSVDPEIAVVPIGIGDPAVAAPPWARYVAGVVAELRPPVGGIGSVTTTLPIGAGLSSSAALEVAVALALGAERAPLALAQLCQRAEMRAVGVPCGIMDQLTSVAGVAGSLLRIDCRSLEIEPVELPSDVVLFGVHSGQVRTLAGSVYAQRRGECEAAEQLIGCLRDATVAEADSIRDATLRRRARHVISENERVLSFVEAIERRDYRAAGALMVASHQSLRDDFDVSTPVLDALVERLVATPGVHGARLTGAGLGGVVVALADADTVLGFTGWRFEPSAGATLG